MTTVEESADLAARGYASIGTEIWEPNPEKPGYLRKVRTRTVGEVVRDIRAAVGEFPDGAEEHFGLFDRYTCWTPGCGHVKYGMWLNGRESQYEGHVGDGKGVCRRAGCKCGQFVGGADREWPAGRIAVFAVRGGSEGQYIHLSVIRSDDEREDLIALAKSLREGKAGRDGAWGFARRVADLLGV